MQDHEMRRQQCVESQIVARGVRDRRVIAAMKKVPRELFVDPADKVLAYADGPLAIGAGQTISQPFVVALMVEALALRGGEKVLEIGSGSGYAAAVLAEMAGEVYTVERIGELAEKAAANLKHAGYGNVHIRHADGTQGWAEAAPFEAILVSAGAPEVPSTLIRQLGIRGRLVVPVGLEPHMQKLVRVTKTAGDELVFEDLARVRFVPLIGKEGWDETSGGRSGGQSQQ